MSAQPLRFDIVDVFTERPFAGNQLAVVHGAACLSQGQCLALAREFGFSETTFPVPVSPASYFTRIFTPGGQIPFAGHPTLGTAWVLRTHGHLSATQVTQACGVGDIGVTFLEDGAGPGEVELSAPARDLAGPLTTALAEDLLADVGLAADDLDGDVYVAGTGIDFVYLPVRASAVSRAREPRRPLSGFAAQAGLRLQDRLEGVSVYSAGPSDAPSADLSVHARVFVPDLAVPEDPATGSAAAGMGQVLAATGRVPRDGRYTVSQGAELGRPSTLRGRLQYDGDRLRAVLVAGGVHPVARGEIQVPPPAS
jgi:trans-2,3-dihydro-3-hydroxyanthranilate isomerase